MRSLCIFLLLASAALAQTASKPPQVPQATGAAAPAAMEHSEVPPTAAVITLNGFCPGKQATGAACKTEVSREQFDKIADALHVPENQRPQFANAYAQMLVLGTTAEQRGIAATPENQTILKVLRLQTLAQLLARNVREEAAQVPQPEIQKYYDEHKDQFTEATLQRIFIPKSAANEKDKADQATVKAEADKIYAAAKAPGADFDKLQKQAYDDLKISATPPPVDLKDVHRDAVPPDQQKVFDVAVGAVSDPIDGPAAFYIYKMVSRQSPPLTQVETQVKQALEQQRFKDEMDKIIGSVKPELNQAYFGTAPGGPRPPSLNGRSETPGGHAASKAPVSAPKSLSNSPPKPK